MDFHRNRNFVWEVLRLMEENKLTNIQKESIYEIVKKLDKRTDLQKERFYMYFGLGPYKEKRSTIKEIAKAHKVTTTSINGAISAIYFALDNISEDELLVMEKILKDYREKMGLPINSFSSKERYYIVEDILEFAKKNLLSDTQKQQVCKVLNNMKNKTDIQLERFMMFYNLKDNEKQYRKCDLARLYNCSPNVISATLNKMSVKLKRIDEVDMLVLKNIVDSCKEQNNN